MAVSSSASNIAAWSFSFSKRVIPTTKLFGITSFVYENPICFSATTSSHNSRSFATRARDSDEAEEENSFRNSTGGDFIAKEDLGYVSQLLVASVVGGAAIKYGSAIFPVITTPNIVQALIMILTPVIVAVFLLIRESSLDDRAD